MPARRALFVSPLLLLLLVSAGCHNTEELPTYPRMSAGETQRMLAERAHCIKTVSAEGIITMTRPDGESIRFDGALAMAPPDRARLRAWKFGQAVFDLTLTREAAWLVAPSDASRADDIKKAGARAGELARTFADLSGRFFDSTLEVKMPKETDAIYVFVRRNADGSSLWCTVDRKTLTTWSYELLDPSGKQRFRLSLDRYALVQGIAFPHRITAVSETGTVQVGLRDVELNSELPDAAFTPPRRAEKLK